MQTEKPFPPKLLQSGMWRRNDVPCLFVLAVAVLMGACQTENPSSMSRCERTYEDGVAEMQENAPNHVGPILHLDSVKISPEGTRHRTILVQTGPLTVSADGSCFGGMFVRTSDCVPLVGPSGERLDVDDLRLGMFVSLWVSDVQETDPGQAGIYGLRVDSVRDDVLECYR